MPSATYYREQAKVLLSLAAVTTDPDCAARLAHLARLYWSEARLPRAPALGFDDIVDEFNAAQFRAGSQPSGG
jgi:hypothetical protein